MFKVTAIWNGKLIEELFATKFSAEHFAERLMMADFTSQPIIEEVV